MTIAAAVTLAVFLSAAPSPKAEARAERSSAAVTGIVSTNFSQPPLVEKQKMPFQSGELMPVELDLTRQTVVTEEATYVHLAVVLAPLMQPSVLKNLRPDEQAAALSAAYTELLNMLAERAARSMNGKVSERKSLQLSFGKGTALAGSTFEDGVPKPNGNFLVHAIVTDAPEIHIVFASSRNEGFVTEYVRSLSFAPASAKSYGR
jgi:hypothetical protein